MRKILTLAACLAFASTALGDVAETHEEKKAKKAQKCSDAVAKYKNKYADDFSGKKKSLQITKGDLSDTQIPRGKKVKTSKFIEETDDQIKMSVKGKKGQVVISKKPGGRLSCIVVGNDKPIKKPVDLLKDEVKTIKDKIASIDASTEKGKKKLDDLDKLIKSCNEVGNKTYSKIRLEVLAISRARAAKIRDHQSRTRNQSVAGVE